MITAPVSLTDDELAQMHKADAVLSNLCAAGALLTYQDVGLTTATVREIIGVAAWEAVYKQAEVPQQAFIPTVMREILRIAITKIKEEIAAGKYEETLTSKREWSIPSDIQEQTSEALANAAKRARVA